MTFKEAMTEALKNRGMFESQANEVMESYMEANLENPMMDRWDEDIHSYPPQMQHILWTGVKDYAYQWIIQNAPEAWFRPMFQYTEMELKEMMQSKAN